MPIVLKLALVFIGLFAVLPFLVDRLLLWMERRGWINYRMTAPDAGSIGNAILQVHALIEPDKRHVLEVRKVDERTAEKKGEDGQDSATPSQAKPE